MNKLLTIALFPLWCSAQSPAPSAKKEQPAPRPAEATPSAAAAPSAEEQKIALRQVEKVAAALKLGRSWQNHVRQGSIGEGMKLWGYAAFEGVKQDVLTESMETQSTILGPLKYSEVMEDRTLIDLEGSAPGSNGEAKGVYVTLHWLNEYQMGLRREIMVLHEPAKGGAMKIIGLRREELPAGKPAAADLAADLGQLALLKLRGAPRERWAPWQREAEALAKNLKLKLPSIPDSATEEDKSAGEKLAALVMTEAPPMFDQLGADGGMHEARAILNAFALLLLYEPGDETCTRLAVLSGAAAEKAKLPPRLWKPVIMAVTDKQKLPAVNEAVQRMAADIAAYLAEQEVAVRVKDAPKQVLDDALKNMEVIPSYKVSGEFAAADGRKSTMSASLGPGAMYLQLEGFDGRKETRLATQQGLHVSHDGEKTWQRDADLEGAMGLCRTLQSPLDRARKFTEKHTFSLTDLEKIDGEQLFVFRSEDAAAPAYWILISRNGPVVRRASMKMKFGDIETTANLVYTRLGKEVDIPEIVGKDP